jgi:hypothetical protein
VKSSDATKLARPSVINQVLGVFVNLTAGPVRPFAGFPSFRRPLIVNTACRIKDGIGCMLVVVLGECRSPSSSATSSTIDRCGEHFCDTRGDVESNHTSP